MLGVGMDESKQGRKPGPSRAAVALSVAALLLPAGTAWAHTTAPATSNGAHAGLTAAQDQYVPQTVLKPSGVAGVRSSKKPSPPPTSTTTPQSSTAPATSTTPQSPTSPAS